MANIVDLVIKNHPMGGNVSGYSPIWSSKAIRAIVARPKG